MRNRIFHGPMLFYFFLLTGILPSGSSIFAEKGITQAGWLITPEEASMAPAPEISGESSLQIESDELNLGPLIEVIKPKEGDRAEAPIEVFIKFTPQRDPIDIESLKVSVVKFISIDITDRVKDYSSPDGIHVQEAKIPQGKHTVRISIADTNGMYSKKEISFEVL
jgi:hypothetical protein